MEAVNSSKKDKQHITDIIRILTNTLHPKRIYLFGSRATGKPKRNSDYDIAIEGSSGSFRDKRKAKEKLDSALGINSIDVVETEKVSSEFEVYLNSSVPNVQG